VLESDNAASLSQASSTADSKPAAIRELIFSCGGVDPKNVVAAVILNAEIERSALVCT
jgi:hypothetical protein